MDASEGVERLLVVAMTSTPTQREGSFGRFLLPAQGVGAVGRSVRAALSIEPGAAHPLLPRGEKLSGV